MSLLRKFNIRFCIHERNELSDCQLCDAEIKYQIKSYMLTRFLKNFITDVRKIFIFDVVVTVHRKQGKTKSHSDNAIGFLCTRK